MTRVRLLLAVAVLSICLVPSVPAAGEQPDERTVTLDLGHEDVDRVYVDGDEYVVVRFDNVFPWASGYEIYQGDRRVTDRTEAREVVRYLAWQRAVDGLAEEDVEEMEEVAEDARHLGSVLAPAYTAVDVVVAHVDRLQENELPLSSRSYWDVAVELYPRLEDVEGLTRGLESRLEQWESTADEVADGLDQVTSTYRSVEADEEFDAGEVEGLRDAAESMREFEEMSQGLESDLRLVADVSSSAAEELEQAGRLGDWVAEPFREAESSSREAANTVGEFGSKVERQRENVELVADSVESEEASAYTGWSRRQNAATRVYLSVAGLLAALLASITGYRYRRELKDLLEDVS